MLWVFLCKLGECLIGKLLTQGYRCHKLRKTSSSGHALTFCLNLVKYVFKDVSEGISQPV